MSRPFILLDWLHQLLLFFASFGYSFGTAHELMFRLHPTQPSSRKVSLAWHRFLRRTPSLFTYNSLHHESHLSVRCNSTFLFLLFVSFLLYTTRKGYPLRLQLEIKGKQVQRIHEEEDKS